MARHGLDVLELVDVAVRGHHQQRSIGVLAALVFERQIGCERLQDFVRAVHEVVIRERLQLLLVPHEFAPEILDLLHAQRRRQFLVVVVVIRTHACLPVDERGRKPAAPERVAYSIYLPGRPQTSSIAMAVPSPPPMHSVARPFFLPRDCRA